VEQLESIRQAIAEMPAWQVLSILAAIVFLALGLRIAFRRPTSHLTAFNGAAGNVLVSRKALRELVRSACLLDEWVEAARPLVHFKGDKVGATVELRLAGPRNLKIVCERVQSHVTALLKKSLSFEQIGEIEIVVKSFGNESGSYSEEPAETGSSTLLAKVEARQEQPSEAKEDPDDPDSPDSPPKSAS